MRIGGSGLRGLAQAYDAALYPNIQPRVDLLRHKLEHRLAGNWFRPHINTLRDYAFSESLGDAFGAPKEMSARLGVQCALAALLHWRVAVEDDSQYNARKLVRQQHVYLRTEAVYLYEADFNPSIERELLRLWTALQFATWDWKQDFLHSRYLATLTDEIYRGDSVRAKTAGEELDRLDQYLAALSWTDIVENRIDWQGTRTAPPLHK